MNNIALASLKYFHLLTARKPASFNWILSTVHNSVPRYGARFFSVELQPQKDEELQPQKDEELQPQKDKEEHIALLDLQFELERGAMETATEAYRRSLSGVVNAGQGASMWPSHRVIETWYGPFRDSLNAAIIKLTKKGVSHAVGANLKMLNADKLPVITLHQTMGLLLGHPEGVSFMQVAFVVGRAVQAEINFERMKAEDKQAFRSLLKSKSGITVTIVNLKAKYSLKKNDWDSKTVVQLGAFLLKHLMSSAMIDSNVDRASSHPKALVLPPNKSQVTSAFIHFYKYYKQGDVTRKQGLMRCHTNIFKLIDDKHLVKQIINTRLLPMVVKPLPWVAPNIGCYYFAPVFLMRTHGHRAQSASLWDADLSTLFKSLNVLGEVPWRINDTVYKYAKQAWENGGGMAALPSREDIPFPDPPDDVDTNPDSLRAWKRTERKVRQLNNDLHSLRCDATYKLEVAEKLMDYTFYLPHNVDFRGRAYPLPPHLNQLGSDLCRGLLLLDRAKPLGKKGLWWLKVHLANLYGVDKIPFDARVAFIDKNMENVFDAADNPLGGNMWWVRADEPWQCLATCTELAAAVRGGDTEGFKSRIPVHQDGSCNGLQHYAALGGDEIGAKKVNLLPSDSPQDVYAGVATLVAKRIHDDAEAGHELGKLLDGKVDRKVVKQTVMTSVYGVTYIGARLQIHNALQDKEIDWRDDDQLYHASAYVTNHTFESLNQMFLGARNIMKWLADCARIVAKQKEPVAWVTPLGLPIVQPYVKTGNYQVKTVVQTVLVAEEDKDLPVNTIKQRSAFPPNYVHSLDSSHMMLTAIECAKRGIDYASVHDSYWTHACSVDEMSQILREQFVELHSQPLLHRLHAWFAKRYGKNGKIEFPPVPERGPLDLKEVLRSPYFFH